MPNEPETKISKSELPGLLQPLFSLKLPRGIEADVWSDGCWASLCGLSAETIRHAVSKIIGGTVPGLSPKWRPTPAEIGAVARGVSVRAEADQARQLVAFRAPRSKILATRFPKAEMRLAVDSGRFPKGSIWLPINDLQSGRTLGIGDVYAPDDTWRPPIQWPAPKDALPDSAAEPSAQLGIDWARLWELRRMDAEPPEAEPQPASPVPRTPAEIIADMEARRNEPIDVTPALLSSLGFTG